MLTYPLVATAIASYWPAAMAVTRDKPVTWTGTLLSKVVPLPSSPLSLEPQAQTVPSERSASTKDPPVAICVTPVSPVT